MDILFILIAFVIGFLISWFVFSKTSKSDNVSKKDFDDLNSKFIVTQNDLSNAKEKITDLNNKIFQKEEDIKSKGIDILNLSNELSALTKDKEISTKLFNNLKQEFDSLKNDFKLLQETLLQREKELSEIKANKESLEKQKQEIENIRKQFNTEFENIASKILDEKSQKFTTLNKENLNAILQPLGDNIEKFKKKIDDVYITESKERFSLGQEVQKLVLLNQKVSEEANNLTNALKGNAKTQGVWGELQLENVLVNAGLVKGREFFVQEFLKDEDGNYLKNEDGTKMQPDVTIAYPDDRKVIIDSKVSLNAYVRYCETDKKEEQDKALDEHIKAIRNHIDGLSRKNYQDFAKSLDFVLMFVAVEPAYILALQKDTELWNYAYNKRIVLISPTNLITALKLIVDLWKRDYQNKNAMEIAKKGAALYDKLVNFVENFVSIGNGLDSVQKNYNEALGQLKDGKGNVIRQAESLKLLGLKTKKQLPSKLISESDDYDEEEIKPQLNESNEEPKDV